MCHLLEYLDSDMDGVNDAEDDDDDNDGIDDDGKWNHLSDKITITVMI